MIGVSRITLVGLVLIGAGCPSNVSAFCNAAAECDEARAIDDHVGSSNDSIDVCIAEEQGIVRALRQNVEEECLKAADAREEWHACAAALYANGQECAAFQQDKSDNECREHIDDYEDAIRNARGDCQEDEG
jgi:hypothetical protein